MAICAIALLYLVLYYVLQRRLHIMSLKNTNSKRIAQKTLYHICDMETSIDNETPSILAKVPL